MLEKDIKNAQAAKETNENIKGKINMNKPPTNEHRKKQNKTEAVLLWSPQRTRHLRKIVFGGHG